MSSVADLPVMIDLGSSDDPLPLDTLFFNIYRSGDILTHTYGSPRVGPRFKEAAGVMEPAPKWIQEISGCGSTIKSNLIHV